VSVATPVWLLVVTGAVAGTAVTGSVNLLNGG
jgi:hypothetical protein